MERADFRTLSEQTRDEIRKRGIALLKKGKTQREVAHILGVHYNSVNIWRKKYQQGGIGVVKAKKRGGVGTEEVFDQRARVANTENAHR